MDTTTSPKVYWSILKTILNNKKYLAFHQFITITIILLILKRRIFFAKQCILVVNTSKLSIDSFKIKSNLLSTISFSKDDIAKIIKNLNPNKAHGFDMISILHVKNFRWLNLELIFKSWIESGKFPINWKKASVVAVHKKIKNS